MPSHRPTLVRTAAGVGMLAAALAASAPHAAAAAMSAAPPAPLAAESVAGLLDARLDELQASYEHKLRQLEEQHNLQRTRDAAIIEELRTHAAALQRPDAAVSEALRRRQLGAVPNLSNYSGIRIKRERSLIAMGADGDTQIVRAGPGQLAVLADNVTVHGDLCLGGEEGCLSVSKSGELLFNGASLAVGGGGNRSDTTSDSQPFQFSQNASFLVQCRDVDTSSVTHGFPGAGKFTGSGAVSHGQYVYAGEIEDCAYGYRPAVGLQWVCEEWGGVAFPSGRLCVPNACEAVNVTAHTNLGGSHPLVPVVTGQPVNVSLIGTDYELYLEGTTTSCAVGANRIDAFEPSSADAAAAECASACIADTSCRYFSVDIDNVDYDTGTYCRLYAGCETTRVAEFSNDVYAILGCHVGTISTTNATWVCPIAGGQAFPSESLCVCNTTDLRLCGYSVATADRSGVYRLRGYGSDAFDAYLDVDDEMGETWMMILGVNHAASDSRGCAFAEELPLSTDDSYASTRLEDYMPEITADDLAYTRFYCETSAHSRVIHFMTDTAFQLQVAIDGNLNSNAVGYWNTGYTLYDDHSGYLPKNAQSVCCPHTGGSMDDSNGFAGSFLMYYGGQQHYAACGEGSRFECDDYPNDASKKTVHHIYVAFADPGQVEAVFQY